MAKHRRSDPCSLVGVTFEAFFHFQESDFDLHPIVSWQCCPSFLSSPLDWLGTMVSHISLHAE